VTDEKGGRPDPNGNEVAATLLKHYAILRQALRDQAVEQGYDFADAVSRKVFILRQLNDILRNAPGERALRDDCVAIVVAYTLSEKELDDVILHLVRASIIGMESEYLVINRSRSINTNLLPAWMHQHLFPPEIKEKPIVDPGLHSHPAA
jgi:hypothetical protein